LLNNGAEQCRTSQAERRWNNTEQYCEAEKELEKVDEILGKLAQRTTKIPKLIPLTTFIYKDKDKVQGQSHNSSGDPQEKSNVVRTRA